jgi:hypothetical protein
LRLLTSCRLVLQIAIPDGEAMKIPKFFRFLRTFAAGLENKIRQNMK